ncbi:hypothetical protein PHYPSEUDO_007033 [Phytophthora pseudosyringae]|uniref:Uncharacterized protein n=1 Tax=Phytophthora pseudosyringae TaxID=221518 RepID=A0A8T1VKD7_9STRA|nr:hypothetical protein PHYPSEUDO_007033 [Phytophthora pseudosyringae]
MEESSTAGFDSGVQDLLDEHERLRTRDLHDNETEAGRQRQLTKVRGSLQQSKRFRDAMEVREMERQKVYGAKMKEYNRKLRLDLQLMLGSDGATNAKDAGAAEQAGATDKTGATEQAGSTEQVTEAGATEAKEQASRGDVEHSSKHPRDSVGGSTSVRLPSTSKKAKLTLQPSIPKATRTPTPKIVDASGASRLNAGFDELTWDAEGAYEGAFEADAADLDDADDDDYVPESGNEGGPSERNISESLRTTRGSKARRRVNFNGEDQDGFRVAAAEGCCCRIGVARGGGATTTSCCGGDRQNLRLN